MIRSKAMRKITKKTGWALETKAGYVGKVGITGDSNKAKLWTTKTKAVGYATENGIDAKPVKGVVETLFTGYIGGNSRTFTIV